MFKNSTWQVTKGWLRLSHYYNTTSYYLDINPKFQLSRLIKEIEAKENYHVGGNEMTIVVGGDKVGGGGNEAIGATSQSTSNTTSSASSSSSTSSSSSSSSYDQKYKYVDHLSSLIIQKVDRIINKKINKPLIFFFF